MLEVSDDRDSRRIVEYILDNYDVLLTLHPHHFDVNHKDF